MDKKNRIINCIYNAIDEYNESTSYPIKNSIDSNLIVNDGSIDSMGIVVLVQSLESAVEEEFGVVISLIDEGISSDDNNPLENVRSAVKYIKELLHEETK
ncbi:MAG: hypothetical protein ACW99A_07010 [Candidatus Kariarchaeaceae archaeon]|jgi:acyl carrier protein